MCLTPFLARCSPSLRAPLVLSGQVRARTPASTDRRRARRLHAPSDSPESWIQKKPSTSECPYRRGRRPIARPAGLHPLTIARGPRVHCGRCRDEVLAAGERGNLGAYCTLSVS